MSSPYTRGLPATKHRYLFLDDTIIEARRDVRRTVHTARRLSDRPLLVPDRPTDQMNVIAGTVLRDTRDNTLHMWYLSQRFRRDGQHLYLCYARSADGLHWDKPNLGVLDIGGAVAHNVVARPSRANYSPGMNVLHCPDEIDERKRFRRITQRPEGTFVAASPDGLHWEDTDAYAFRGSDAATVFYDRLSRRYIATTIQDAPIGRFTRRTPALATSRDFRQWSDFRVAFECDDLDDKLVIERIEKRRAVLRTAIPDHFHEEINNLPCFRYADSVIGLPVMFDCCGYDEWKGTPGGPGSARDDAVTHVQLAWCRDAGLRDWRRPPSRDPFLPITSPPAWDCGFVGLNDAPVRVGDELWFYYSGVDRSQQHPMYTLADGWRFEQGDLVSGIATAACRLDGFASLDADRQGGAITTKAITLAGETIRINAAVHGELVAELLDATGKPLPGFSRTDCVPIRGDSVRHRLRFRNAKLSSLTGRQITLRLTLFGGMIFALDMEPRPLL